MTVKIDRNIFNDTVISKAVYWLSGDYCISRRLISNDIEEITAQPCRDNRTDDFEQRLINSLNDFKLRQIVADETRNIKTILYAKAFAEYEDLCEEDIHD